MSNPQMTHSRAGRIWLGTDIGVAIIDPMRIRSVKTGPPVIIERALIDGKAAVLDSSRAQSLRGSELQIEYSAVNPSSLEAVRFRYKLAGLDSDWKEGGDRHELLFTNLTPGKYGFQVEAYDADHF
jgi:hypothetical protein